MILIFSKKESPRSAAIQYNCLQNLEEKVNKIFKLSSSMKEAQIKGTRHMEEINKYITFISRKFEEIEDRKEKERQIAELKNDKKTLHEKLETMDKSQIVMTSILEGTALLSLSSDIYCSLARVISHQSLKKNKHKNHTMTINLMLLFGAFYTYRSVQKNHA